MTIEEGKAVASEMFTNKYNTFLEDVNNMEENDREFSMKYTYILTKDFKKSHGKNTKTNLKWFTQNIFNGMWWEEWIKLGFDRELIFELVNDGFFSRRAYTSSRRPRRGVFVFLKQDIAKEIIFG